MNILRKYGEKIEEQLRSTTYPFAVKMLKSINDIPKEAKRPRKDFNTCLSTCQCFSLTRKFGMTIAMLKEDMWCPMPVIGFGLEEPPQYYLDGHNRYPDSVISLEAGAISAREMPRFNVGNYVGVVSAPLTTISFEPDLIIIYCNSAQLLRLLLARSYKDGRDITSKLSGNAACVYSIVLPIQTGECCVSVPCDGDRRRAGAQEDEIIFSIPVERLDDLILGLREGPGRIPNVPNMMPEYKLAPSYAKINKLMGMKKANGHQIKGFSERLPYE